MARLNQSSVVGRRSSGDRRREIGDSFIYSPHTPHPTPNPHHPLCPPPKLSGGLGAHPRQRPEPATPHAHTTFPPPLRAPSSGKC
ncbi:MAG: hypothetical protein DWQ51_14170 [Microcystis wesenbergii TW10]|uniref:Uncharacterized protein n=1 Tax=Microcystis wesenbergii TW10 TaxID=2060474 RepID=A0A3E0LU98_9CHRO|nr:MAG: hypothetical protein DWQ51_14170 [Microcystis wesenbergii TW10]